MSIKVNGKTIAGSGGAIKRYLPYVNYGKNEIVLSSNESTVIYYKSLEENNVGNNLQDTRYWQKLEGSGGGGTLQMFDTVLKDYLLSFEESKGLALQGTYVYKEAVAGTRYGYPDFYERCLKEFDEATITENVNSVTVKVHSNGHKFYDIANKEAIDAFFNTMGTAWFYGVDIENQRIFLPRNNYFEQVTSDVSQVGKSIEAGLPNITGAIHFSGIDGWAGSESAFYETLGTGAGRGHNGSSGSCDVWFRFDASRSSKVYNKSNTVQPNAVKKLLYICVGNTEANSTIAVEQITTTNNDTIPLFTAQYFDFEPNNASWLKAGSRSNNGSIYKSCYSTLVNCLYGENTNNIKVIDIDNMVTEVDYSCYWKVDKTSQSFITPDIASTYANNRILVDKKAPTDTDPTWYNLYSDGWLEQGGKVATGVDKSFIVNLVKDFNDATYSCNITLLSTTTTVNNNAVGPVWISSITQTNFTCVNDTWDGTLLWRACGYTEIPNPSQYTQNVNLYFKVANAVENLQLLDAGKVIESLNNKIDLKDCKAYPIETYQSGNSWYRLWSDGWCEQGGQVIATTNGGVITTVFLKPYKQLPNVFINFAYSADGGSYYQYLCARNVTTTQFQFSGNVASTQCTMWTSQGYVNL